VTVLVLLGASLGCLACAPLVLPDSYDVVRHTVADATAQGVPGGWLARTGLALLGVAVLALAAWSVDRWSSVARAAHGVYGTAVVLLAVFAPLAWDGRPGSQVEATWHAVLAAVAVGAFVVGVVAVRVGRGTPAGAQGVVDVLVVAAVVVPAAASLTMAATSGVTERLLFAAAYLWYGVQTVRRPVVDRPA
jgi:hypothetical protein